ncbi:hypothetical protein H9654_10940 [Stenotrophomonas sp. Sa5BUN4]|uniref:Uncharacterized protein n=1 Tax=Stenotrophomonas lacuserhaii TaxID=2760084 RepID=A0A8X8K2N1_9GAMM|nr:hypothetical protein [Stenotrophomonas pennii]MBD7954714.1 hypothetical protein [Stenotrophomonas pennii]
MDPHYPLSAERLYALMGDRMIDFPPHFIERLERRLEEFETSRTNARRVMHLRVVRDTEPGVPLTACGCAGEPQREADVAVSIRTLQALASIFEVLHSLHMRQQDGQQDSGLGRFLIEELSVCGRELVRSSAGAMGGQP